MDTTTQLGRRDPRPAIRRAVAPRDRDLRHELASRLGVTAAAWLVGVVVTAVIVLTPEVVVSDRSTGLHLVLSTGNACIAIFAAYLIHGRYRRSRRYQDLLLAQGLILLGLAGLGLALGMEAGNDPVGRVALWTPLVVRALGSMFILLAAVGSPTWFAPRTGRWRTVWVPVVIGAVVALTLFLLRAVLPPVIETPGATDASQLLSGNPWLSVTEGVAAVLLFVASVAFALQSRVREDVLFRLLGPAFAFLGFARVNFLLFPSVNSQWVYSGDVLRGACYALLLYGGFREVEQFWHAQSKVAVLDDRRRLARELHDGVIQELAYIRSEAATLAHTQPAAVQVVNAADRGLDEARAALQALGTSTAEPVSVTLHRAAREVANRYGVGLEVELDDAVEVTHDQKHALMRIVREAVSNAARHGSCTRVALRLQQVATGRALVVVDDGAGFDVESVIPQATGFGLVSMRERAQALPGELWFDSRPGAGTTVNVRW